MVSGRGWEFNATYECRNIGGSAKCGALGPFGLLVLTDKGLSEQTPIYFYIAKDAAENFNNASSIDS